MLIRKFIAATVLMLGAMCMAASAVHADVGLDPFVTVDQVASADFMLDITAPAVELAVPIAADLPGSREGDGDDQPIAAFCSVAPHLHDGDPMRIDDPGWCLTYHVD